MKLFSFGFSITLAFLIIVAVVSLHMAYFPAPEGPKRPEFPESTTPFSMSQTVPEETRALPFVQSESGAVSMPAQPISVRPSTSSALPVVSDLSIQQTFPDSYQSDYEQYQKDLKKYEEDSKEFMKEEMIPYIKNMIIRHLLVLAVLEILAILFVRFISVSVGGAYAFGGLLGVVFGAFGGIFIIPYTIISSFVSSMATTDQSEIFDAAMFFSGIGWTAVGAVVVLTLAAILLVDGRLNFKKSSAPNLNLPPEAR